MIEEDLSDIYNLLDGSPWKQRHIPIQQSPHCFLVDLVNNNLRYHCQVSHNSYACVFGKPTIVTLQLGHTLLYYKVRIGNPEVDQDELVLAIERDKNILVCALFGKSEIVKHHPNQEQVIEEWVNQ